MTANKLLLMLTRHTEWADLKRYEAAIARLPSNEPIKEREIVFGGLRDAH
jgi:hypothetical protein